MCIHLPSSLSEVSQVIRRVLLQQWKQGEVNYLREEVNSNMVYYYFTKIIFCLNVHSELHLTIGVSPDIKSLSILANMYQDQVKEQWCKFSIISL